MKFKMVHENYNVVDLDKSMEFYSKALGLKESRRKEAKDGSYIIVYMSNEEADFELELTWLKEWKGNYNLGDCEFHLAFETDDMEAAHKLHEEMECICFGFIIHWMGYFIWNDNGNPGNLLCAAIQRWNTCRII